MMSVQTYEVRISWDEFSADHNYGFSSWYQWKGETREEAVTSAENFYGANSANSAVAYQLRETVETVLVEEKVLNGFLQEVTTTTKTQARLPIVYRLEKEYTENVILPREKREQERVDSGEAALSDAYQEELDANHARTANGEPLVHDAQIALLKFHNHEIPAHLLPKTEETTKKSLLSRIFS
jgi:hypothetical protein